MRYGIHLDFRFDFVLSPVFDTAALVTDEPWDDCSSDDWSTNVASTKSASYEVSPSKQKTMGLI